MPHWKTILTYDGTPYNGWQVQPSLPTVQGTLAQAIHRITGESVLPQGSGRTDTGVHALGQVASFSLAVPIPAANFHRALNDALPPSIRILTLEPVPETFHARHSALRKTYEYRILSKNIICSPFLAPYVWQNRYPLDLEVLQQAAAYIIGTHDFTSFAAVDPDLTTRTATSHSTDEASFSAGYFANLDTELVTEAEPSTPDNIPQPGNNTRTIYTSIWHQHEDLLIYRVTGSGFLHHMVRNLVGTFAEAGANRIPCDSIPAILAARTRSAAGITAPARGLFLLQVEYQEAEVLYSDAEADH